MMLFLTRKEISGWKLYVKIGNANYAGRGQKSLASLIAADVGITAR